jgi:hypothetical protein
MKPALLIVIVSLFQMYYSCDDKSPDQAQGTAAKEVVYDETGCLYTSYNNLVMAGYQGWFAADGDESGRGWYHYKGSCGFKPGCTSVDFWPDMREYEKKYQAPFTFQDGSQAHLFSPYDESTVDLHFKWMKDYNIDGVFMQRFVGEVRNPQGKRHFNKVLESALKASEKYGRAISIMYDLSGCSPDDVAFAEQDWNELQRLFSLFDNTKHPTYVRHNGKPLVAIWGVGFNDGRKYSTEDAAALVHKLKGTENKVAVLLGVPYYWRTLTRDTENSPALHALIKECDMIMPWAVGRYNSDSYANVSGTTIAADIQWCKQNGVDYVPGVFPGFSWGNLKKDPAQYNSIPRNKGDFLWAQIAGAKMRGARSLYVCMFDEIDEGTAIFKCAREGELPLNGSGKFVGIEPDLDSDYYLWLTGQGTKWFHGESGFGSVKPIRSK